MRRVVYNLTASGLLIIPIMSAAAEAVIRSIEADSITLSFWVGMIFVQIIIVVGYLASSLPQWADWTDGLPKRRLELIASIFAAVLAGNIAYYGGLYYLLWPQIGAFLAAGFAAFAGDKFIAPVATKLSDVFGAAFSRNGGTSK